MRRKQISWELSAQRTASCSLGFFLPHMSQSWCWRIQQIKMSESTEGKKISKRSLLFLAKGPESDNITKQKSLENNHSTHAKYHRKKKKKSVVKYPSMPAKAEWVGSIDRLLPRKDCMEVPSPPLLQALCQKRPRKKLEFSFLMPWLAYQWRLGEEPERTPQQ